MDKVKKRVLEFLAVRQLKKDMKGWSWREEGGCSDSSWWSVTESLSCWLLQVPFCVLWAHQEWARPALAGPLP